MAESETATNDGHISGSKKQYPTSANLYTLIEEIGAGANSQVWRALCKPFNEEVAIKIIDLERYASNVLEEVLKEIKIMSSCNHNNVVKYHTSFVADTFLYIVTELLEGGSIFDLMRYSHPHGLDDEELIATILKQVLTALQYFHSNGQIHRDIKAGNILVAKNGDVRIADFGVSGCLFENGARRKNRQTFVGSPCWMAPEVMEQIHGYDYKADIWSFGITALELANGKAPYADYPPMKVMYLTLECPAPTLDLANKKFSKNFKDMIDSCLKKDPTKRPNASQLLKHRFFSKTAKSEYVKSKLLDNLPPLSERIRKVKQIMEEGEKSKSRKNQQSKSSETLASESGSESDATSLTTTSSVNPSNQNYTTTSTATKKPISGWNWEKKIDTSKTSGNHQTVVTTPSTPGPTASQKSPPSPTSSVSSTSSATTYKTATTSEPTPVSKQDLKSIRSARQSTATTTTTATHIASNSSSQEKHPQNIVSPGESQNGMGKDSPADSAQVTDTTSTKVKKKVETKGRFIVSTIEKNQSKSNSSNNEKSNQISTESTRDNGQKEESNISVAEGSTTIDTSKNPRKSITKQKSRKFDIKDIEPSLIPPKTTLDLTNSSKLRKHLLNTPSLSSLEKQLNNIYLQSQKQLHILNSIYQLSEANHLSMEHPSPSTVNKESNDIISIMSQLQNQVRELVNENKILKSENEKLQNEITMLKKREDLPH